jgi:hypothetical protein
MFSFRDTLDRVVDDVDGCFETKRKNLSGNVFPIETSFDHALIVLKLFELTGEKEYLRRWLAPVHDSALIQDQVLRWNFSSKVTDIPPDADSTAMNLLLLRVADSSGVPGASFDVVANASQFEDLQDVSGGVKTYFGSEHKNDVDPVVNTLVAFFYELNYPSSETNSGIRAYLLTRLKNLSARPDVSEYYVGATYFLERMAKLTVYAPSFIDDESAQSLDLYLKCSVPRNSLDIALLSVGAAHRGLVDRAVELNRELKSRMNKNGTWSFATLYRQRTPRFNYGNERLTTLFALEALKVEQEDFQVRKFAS